MATQSFYVEDICALKHNPTTIGIVERTLGDVDTHESHPQDQYDTRIKRHEDIPHSQFQKFLKDGIPPSGTVLVSWDADQEIQLIPTVHLQLLDRCLLVGDVVKRNPRDHTSGIVVSTNALCTLSPVANYEDPNKLPPLEIYKAGLLDPKNILVDIPAAELQHSQTLREGNIIIYKDWVGRITDGYDVVTVRLGNGTVVEVEDPSDLEPLLGDYERFEVGDIVRTVKGNLRRGKWVFGSFNPNVEPVGQIVSVRSIRATVRWLFRRLGTPNPATSSAEPPEELETDDLESGEIHVYDKTRLPRSAPDALSTINSYDFTVGNRVRFRDPAGAAMKYDGSRFTSDGIPQGIARRIPRRDTLGFDLNVYRLVQVRTEVEVQWQDLSITPESSTSLIPDSNVEDENEVWPGEIIHTDERKPLDDDNWAYQPCKVGIVQGVRAQDRIAQVRWCPDAVLRYAPQDEDDSFAPATVLPNTHLGTASGSIEEVSLYDIQVAPGINKRRGDFVVIMPSTGSNAHISEPDKLDWFGEVISLGLDGLFTVRLGALDDVRDIKVAPEALTLVFSTDMESDFDDDVDYDEYDSMDEDEMSDDEDVEVIEQRIEYMGNGGEPIEADEDETAWSTEDELESENADTPMTDATPPNAAGAPKQSSVLPTSNTTDPANATATTTATAPAPAPVARTTGMIESASVATTDILSLSTHPNAPPSFAILETSPPPDHKYASDPGPTSTRDLRRITKEHKILSTSLPDSVFVRTYESRLDLLRVLIVGPMETPYELAPFVIDLRLPSDYPSSPPDAFFHSWTDGHGPVNPNLYEDGKICLSLLGTWHTDERNESWNPARSTVLQVLVSLLGLVLVKEPYYNEAGYEARAGTEESRVPSALYNERTYFRSRAFITRALTQAVSGFEEEIRWLYVDRKDGAPRLLDRAVELAEGIIQRSEAEEAAEAAKDGIWRVSKGAVVKLRRQVEDLKRLNLSVDSS
ncbi:hypothetical protein LTS18_007857 [Coniosporium uncinatum]|uniref:Uncharacterized protein n=1 Tax=Coniosporium uncinatum TaxID=93489 RepID=A0ACC3DZZ8_9PEZI|nr:hypothetical protein LTS18_007857 [Coniosporium uncinatum]